MSAPDVVATVADLRARVALWRAAGERVALVPTMGALHPGHLSLVEQAGRAADRVVVSIFVNPTQFAPTEDLATYPRDLEGDLAKLATVSTDLVFAPTPQEMYPAGASTVVTVGGPSAGLESDARPHFFAGVATVVSKLLIQVAPDVAVFGEKDFQQLAVIRRLVADLHLPVEILSGATLREADGLAMSSRNVYLTPADRERAPALHRAIQRAAARIGGGEAAAAALADARDDIAVAGFTIDYVEHRDAATLGAPQDDRPGRILVAARIAGVRLIDNVPVSPKGQNP